jgi:hypothetical protein
MMVSCAITILASGVVEIRGFLANDVTVALEGAVTGAAIAVERDMVMVGKVK